MACSAGPACWLALAVGLLARHRFFNARDIDGAGLTEASPRAKLIQALTQNTLEQTGLAIVAYGLWLFVTPAPRAQTVVLCAALFSFGRLLFFLSYSRGAPARSLGFAVTFYPTAGLLVLSLPSALKVMFGVLGGE
jgi:uncharacterized MAPEG superfamily protein